MMFYTKSVVICALLWCGGAQLTTTKSGTGTNYQERLEELMAKMEERLSGIDSKLSTFMTLTTSNTQNSACLDGWTRVLDSCYKVPQEQLKWQDAYSHCKGLNAHLAVIEDQDELDAIQSFLQKTKLTDSNPDVWVNAKKLTNGNYYWEVCSCKSFAEEECSFSGVVKDDLWRKGQPDNYKGIEQHAELDVQCDSKLNDNGDVQQRFLCEYEL